MTLAQRPTEPAPVRHIPTIFGTRELRADHVLRFPQGLLGFPTGREWLLFDAERAHFHWLQSLDCPELAFLLVDPFVAFEGFGVDVPVTALRTIKQSRGADIALFAPVALPARAGEPATANLCGPVLINWSARVGVQCVIESGQWSLREALPSALYE